jgi:transcriptional enhancer factor
MYVRDTHEDPPKHIYTYTQSPKNGPSRLDDVYIRDARQWRHAFPSLSAVSLDRFTDCELVVCDASIAVMTDPLPKDVELATQFWLKGEAFYANFSSFSVRNSFIDANPAAHPPSVSKIRTNEPDSDFSSHNALSRHYLVPFCSKFWARRMQHLSTFLRHARSHPDVEERAKREAYVRSSLERLTATQEIFGVPKGGSKPVRIAAIFWRFSRTVGREEGRTVWRSVVYSPQRQSLSQPQPAVAVHEIYPVTQQPLTAYPALSFDLPPTHQHTVYDPIAIHGPEHPGPFGLDTLSTMAPEGAFALPTTALPLSIPTSNSEHIYHHIPHSDAHFHCLPSLFHSYDSNIDFPHSRPNSHLQPHTQHHDANQYTPLSSATTQHHDQSQYTPLNNGNGVMGGLAVGMSSNELDFTGGSINICLEPAIGMGSYPDIGTYNHTPLSLSHEFPIHAHGGQVQDHNAGVSSGMESANLFSVEGASARPWNSYQELMEQLEGCEAGVGIGLGVSMGGPVESAYAGTGHEGGEGGMWKLQSPFEGVEERDVKEEERGQVAGGY